ncbi:hypothetical protein DD238_006165 [Peronospora effusa]|uniref:Retroviral polymerase SH3-like domain-containing protein n=1 Tax=Peronospora effusa TaxID=542832 RepID=A0A3M6VTB1_9STRA|nr:hypothetical protein DD238_006165 [Peronospora effusa]
MNCTIIVKSRSMLHYKGIPMDWEAETVNIAVYLANRKEDEVEPKSFRCLLLKYPKNVKGYRVYDLDTSKTKVSPSVKLDERELKSTPDIEMESMQPEKIAFTPLLMPQDRSAPTEFKLEMYRGPPIRYEKDKVPR